MKQLRIHRLYKQDDPAERARVDALLADYEAFVRQQFELFLSSVRDPAVLDAVELALAEGRVMDAFAIVDSYVIRLGDAIVAPAVNVGRAEAQALATQPGVADSGVAVSFNPTSPEVVEAQRRNRLDFVVQVSEDQRLAISQALTSAAAEGLGPAETARAFRDALGLTSYQQGLVESYRALLEMNSAQALERQLRDRRYDRGLENAIEEDEILPQARIDLMVDRYRERMLQMRGETIARTEAGRVAESTRHLSALQVADAAGARNLTVKQWTATRDARTRDTHAEMDGQARLMDDYFDSPSGATLLYPHDSDAPAAEVINCRCTVQHHVFSTEEEVRTFLQENGQGRYDDMEPIEPEELEFDGVDEEF